MTSRPDPATRAHMARLRRELPQVVAALDQAAVKRERSRAVRAVNAVESEPGYGLYGDEYDTGLVPYHDVVDAVLGRKKPR